MKNIIIIASLLLGMPLMAQTKVVKKNAVKANNFGITYSLPKTSLGLFRSRKNQSDQPGITRCG